ASRPSTRCLRFPLCLCCHALEFATQFDVSATLYIVRRPRQPSERSPEADADDATDRVGDVTVVAVATHTDAARVATEERRLVVEQVLDIQVDGTLAGRQLELVFRME